jgi:D-3-phosphoglycerate dehydrogenase
VNAERLARAKKGIRIVNTARGDLIDEAALADAIEAGQVAGAGLDVFDKEPTVDHRLQKLPQVIATPHIAASTREGQELVGVETATALRDFLKDGVIRNAVNFPSLSTEEFKRLLPFATLGERLGTFIAQMNDHPVHAVSVRYYGDLAQDKESKNTLVVNAVLAGIFKPILSTGITLVNASAVAAERGIEVVESHSTRPRYYRSLISVVLRTTHGERWVEGAVFERSSPRLVLLDGISVEAPLNGTMIVFGPSRYLSMSTRTSYAGKVPKLPAPIRLPASSATLVISGRLISTCWSFTEVKQTTLSGAPRAPAVAGPLGIVV